MGPEKNYVRAGRYAAVNRVRLLASRKISALGLITDTNKELYDPIDENILPVYQMISREVSNELYKS
jgi:hypothetical protein